MSKSNRKPSNRPAIPSTNQKIDEAAKRAADRLLEGTETDTAAFQEAAKPLSETGDGKTGEALKTLQGAAQEATEALPPKDDNQTRINWTPIAKNAAEFRKLSSEISETVSAHIQELETNDTARLALLTCDFIFLNNSGAFDQTHDEKGNALPEPKRTPRFDPNSDKLFAEARKAIKPFVFPEPTSDAGDTEAQKKLVMFSSPSKIGSLKQMFPAAIRKGILVLLGDAEIGWTERAKKYTARALVLREAELPKGDEGNRYVRCVAAPFSTLMPMIHEKDSLTGRSKQKRPNMDQSLILLTEDLTNLLYLKRFGKAGDVITGESGWLEKKKAERAANSGQGATATVAQGALATLVKADAKTFADSFVAKANDPKSDLVPEEITQVSRAFRAAVERVRTRYKDGKMPSAISYAFGEAQIALQHVVETDAEGHIMPLDENGRRVGKYAPIPTPKRAA